MIHAALWLVSVLFIAWVSLIVFALIIPKRKGR